MLSTLTLVKVQGLLLSWIILLWRLLPAHSAHLQEYTLCTVQAVHCNLDYHFCTGLSKGMCSCAGP